MDKYQKVQGTDSLFRDPHNGAILNVNVDEIKRAKILKAERKKKALEFEAVKEDVETMKQDMADIKGLLQRLVEKNG
mgnify:FL=1|jgi:hypothetical protein|tara:strand:- start:191 stop:421 length:231 start_codon:yes stop_codon:yes gene_type:complete